MCDQQSLRSECAYATCLNLLRVLNYRPTPFGISKLKKEDAGARLSLHLSKYHIVGNHVLRLIYTLFVVTPIVCEFLLGTLFCVEALSFYSSFACI